jgi:hypothetical protein
MTSRQLNWIIAPVLILFWLAFGLATMSDFMVRSDAGSRWAGGVRNFYFLMYRDATAIQPQNTTALAKKLQLQEHTFLTDSAAASSDDASVFDALAFFTFLLFHRALGWLEVYASYQAAAVVVFCLLVAGVYRFGARLFGPWAGVTAAFVLGFYPPVVEPFHNDLGAMWSLLFSFAAGLAFYSAVTRRNPAMVLLSPVAFGLALAANPASLYLLVAFIPWFVVHKQVKESAVTGKEIAMALLFLPVAYATWLAVFPGLWAVDDGQSFFSRQSATRLFVFLTGADAEVRDWNWIALALAILRTPIYSLVLLLLGIYEWGRRFIAEKDSRGVLFVLWLVAALLMAVLPVGSGRGVDRNAFEFLPPMALICGLGAMRIWAWVVPFLKKPALKTAAASVGGLALVFAGTQPVLGAHPYEGLYFNMLAGNFTKVLESFGGTIDMQRASLLPVVSWVNAHAHKEAEVAFLGYGDYEKVIPALLRKDLKKSALSPFRRTVGLNLGDQRVQGDVDFYAFIGYVVIRSDGHEYGFLRKFLELEFQEPVKVVMVEGVEVAKIFHMQERFGFLDMEENLLVLQFGKGDAVRDYIFLKKQLQALSPHE